MKMTNKEMAIQFLKMCALESPRKAFDLFVRADFTHHNQYFQGDRESLVNAMIEADRTHPNKKFEIQRIFENEDTVAAYSRVVKDAMEIGVVHMMRFENGQIVEMWDIGQILEKNSPNKNGMF